MLLEYSQSFNVGTTVDISMYMVLDTLKMHTRSMDRMCCNNHHAIICTGEHNAIHTKHSLFTTYELKFEA